MYDPTEVQTLNDQIARLEHNLTNHPPADSLTVQKMQRIRADAKALGISILSYAPESRERAIAVHELEDTVMWAIKAIAVNQG